MSTLALAYVRVSTTLQAEEGASLDAQETALRAEAERRGWDIEVIREEGKSAKNLKRPALQSALARLDRGEAQVLMSVRLDRLSRSVSDFAGLVDRARQKGWGLVLQSPALDLNDPAGEFTANVLASAAQYERRLISVRTREGIAQRKSEGATFGRKVDEEFLDTYRQVLDLRSQGLGLTAIARTMTERGVPTARGGKWFASTVQGILNSETAKTLSG